MARTRLLSTSRITVPAAMWSSSPGVSQIRRHGLSRRRTWNDDRVGSVEYRHPDCEWQNVGHLRLNRYSDLEQPKRLTVMIGAASNDVEFEIAGIQVGKQEPAGAIATHALIADLQCYTRKWRSVDGQD